APPAVLLDECARLLELLLGAARILGSHRSADVADHDVRAGLGEGNGMRSSLPSGAAGHECHMAAEVVHLTLLLRPRSPARAGSPRGLAASSPRTSQQSRRLPRASDRRSTLDWRHTIRRLASVNSTRKSRRRTSESSVPTRWPVAAARSPTAAWRDLPE